MTAPLRDLLTELAEEQPAVRVGPDLYTRARRARRRGLAVQVGAAAAVVGVGLGASLVAGPLTGDGHRTPAPATSDRKVAMPARLYAVPERLASHHEDGYRWHADVRADGLAIGPTAAVFPVNGGAVMAVSAVDGGYRGLELPGFDESSYFRFEDAPVALSPDGERLAWTWNPDVISGSDVDRSETGIRIADLVSGEVTDVLVPSRYGVYAHGFGWSPDGRYLAYELQRVTSPTGEVRGSANYRIGRLDTTTGNTVVTGLRSGIDAPPGVSDAGAVALSGGGYNGVWSPERGVQRFQGPFESVAWAPSGERMALATGPGRVAVADESGITREVSAPSLSGGRTRVLGWADDSRFVVLDEGAATLSLLSPDLEEREVVVRANGLADLHQLSVAVALLDEPTRDTDPPDWPTDWGSVAWWTGLGLAGALLAAAAVYIRRRRTR